MIGWFSGGGLFARLFRHHRPHTRLDLTAPPLLAEVYVHVKANGDRMVCVSKTEASPEETMLIVQSVIDAGMDLASKHGIQVDFTRR